MLGFPFWTTSTDSEPLICGMPACRATSMLATVLELYTVPMMASGRSLMALRITATDVGGSDWVSMTSVSSRRPMTPPALLMSSTARSTPSRHIVPEGAPPPVISATMASFKASCVDPTCAIATTAITATPSAITVRMSGSLELQDGEAGVGVGQVHEPVPVDVAVGGLDHLRPVRARIDHALGIRRHVESDLARLERIVDVVDAHTCVVVRREDQARALERAGPVLVKIVSAEVAALGTVVRLGGLGHRRDADGIARLAHVEDPDVAQAVATVGAGRLVANNEQVAIGQRQGRVRAAAEGRIPVPVNDQPRLRRLGD